MAGEPPHLPVTLLDHSPPRVYPTRLNPGRRLRTDCLTLGRGRRGHRPAEALGGEDGRGIALPGYVSESTWSVLKRACASEVLPLITIPDPASASGKLFGSARGHGFTRQSTEAGIKIWRSAAAAIDGRLKETGVMFGVAAKEDRSREMANRSSTRSRPYCLGILIEFQHREHKAPYTLDICQQGLG
ncbi:hypothetical protein EYF80_043524 [Liparis tanakae]|uniref:Uncharacterized protein n=1 Tax=Liparis tanakae TaxID=230148 RepID=A0A4Z2FYB9_9TELE|nr:hypothetical protein EYF80_043524 [Liparis tanakae]